jgi:RNA polymerase sigma-70 factor, ECF subfamily
MGAKVSIRVLREDHARLGDVDLHILCRARDERAVRELTRRFNQRLFRVAWAILKNPSDAEEVVQDVYVKAFTAQNDFQGQSAYATWLTRIAINEALERRRYAARRAHLLSSQGIAEMADFRARVSDAPISNDSPEQTAARAQFARRLERAIAKLPDAFRVAFVMREMEGLSVEETAALLDIPPQTVKTRLLRARRRLQEILEPELQAALHDAFPFAGERCVVLTNRLLGRLHTIWQGEPND